MLATTAGPVAPLVAGVEYDVRGDVATPLVSEGLAVFVEASGERAVRVVPEKRVRRAVPKVAE
jgi:hypothetical protein